MEKVTKFLEQNVQWLVIGLGAAFAMWMAYGYVVNPPAHVQVDGETYTASNLARHTRETVAGNLEQKINSTATITLHVPKPAERFKEAMAWKGASDTSLAGGWGSQPSEVYKSPDQTAATPRASGQTPIVLSNGQQATITMGVAMLVVPPAGTPDEFRVGRSSVVIPQTQPAPVEGQPAPQPVQPGLPVAGALPPGTVDKDWVTQSFKIPMAELDAAFKKAAIPPPLNQTHFVHVELVRQELGSGGEPIGAETRVKQANFDAAGQAAPTYPGDEADKQANAAYDAWAVTNTPTILQPAFYSVVKGDLWLPPGTTLQALQQSWTLDNPPPNWKEDQRWYDGVMARRRQLQKQKDEERRKAAPRPQPGASPSRGGRGGQEGIAPGMAPRDAARPAPPPRTPAGEIRDAAGPGMSGEGMPGGFPGAGAPVAPNMPQPGVAYPTGDFDPSKWKEPIQCWGHDTDVVPGKTYRYKMRYRIRNPLYQVGGNVSKDPKLTQIYACVSPFSAWSKPVTVPDKTNIFIARGLVGGADRVQFEVFKWEDGQQHSEVFAVSPGDQVGIQKGDIDFSTGWMLVGSQVDARTNEAQILLVDKDGKLMVRSRKADESDPLYKMLRDQVATTKQNQQQVQGAAGGPPPIPGGPPVPGGVGRAP